MFKQIAQAVQYCHQNKIMHRDIKPENILVSVDSAGKIFDLKLADFGKAVRFDDDTKLTEKVGTTGYMPPEMLSPVEFYSKEVDIFSLGVILFNLVSGEMPFFGQDDYEITEMVFYGAPHFTSRSWGQCSSNVKDLVSELLNKNRDTRIQIEKVMDHDWLKFNDELLNDNFGQSGAPAKHRGGISNIIGCCGPLKASVSRKGYLHRK